MQKVKHSRLRWLLAGGAGLVVLVVIEEFVVSGWVIHDADQ